jgi:acetyl-CoA carboxylase carboxyl transferase subunit beta
MTPAKTTTDREPHFDVPWPASWTTVNPLSFAGYVPPQPDEESVRAGLVHAPRGSYVLIECDFARSGGTMGTAAGETIVEAYARATADRLPVALIVSSGGARLQEGFFSLMQMARTSSAAAAHRSAGLRSAVAFRSPTTGGVFASWASTPDIRAAAPNAVIGFGGPRVVEAVTGSLPPSTSHNAEAAFRDGNLDALIDDESQQLWLEQAIGVRAAPRPVAAPAPSQRTPVEDDWKSLVAVRQPEHPSGGDWLGWLADEWVELRGTGSRVRAGVARISAQDLVIVAMDRDRSGGLPSLPTPSDFRLAQRAIRFADRTGLPVLTLIDTPGADPSPSSEREGLAGEISQTLMAMSELRTPSVAVVVGEGGSGGAMALGHADTLLMLESTVFAVIGPEAGAAVLYRDAARAPELARAMRITATDLKQLGLIDGVLSADVAVVRERVLAALDSTPVGERARRPALATATALRR